MFKYDAIIKNDELIYAVLNIISCKASNMALLLFYL